MTDIELLRKFSLFKELNESQLQKFAAYVQEKHYPHETRICSKGEKGNEIFFITRGYVSVELPLYRTDAGQKNVSQLREGDFFGELSFFDNQERSAYVEALGDVELLVLSRKDYDKVIEDNIEEGCRIQNKIIAGLVDIIRKMNEIYSSAGFSF